MPMTPESIAFLRKIGTPEEAIEILAADEAAAITGDVLASYLRAAYSAGRHWSRDCYVWHSAAELMGEPGA